MNNLEGQSIAGKGRVAKRKLARKKSTLQKQGSVLSATCFFLVGIIDLYCYSDFS